jgi:NAD(P)-dependent dehydrogenase (short-subunit alcohol dehydrogenase family)
VTFATYPSLRGRVVFISGGASGIGADMVRAFAGQGALVAFNDVQRASGSALASELTKAGQTALFLEADITDISALRESIAETRDKLGPIGVLVNNAANDKRQSFDTIDVADWDLAQNVNLRHHFFAAQAVHSHMKQLGGGAIINMSSIAWRGGAAEMPAYAAAKAAIVGLTHALSRAFGADNIRVNALEPGAVITERQRELWFKTQDSVDAIAQRQAIKRTLLGEEIARTALFLASDDSRMITKQSITVDAGLR